MITRLEIENFKAIKHLAIDLDPLTVLVGPNDSGKSTILQALELLSRSLTRPVYEAGQPSIFDAEPVESIHGGNRSEAIRLAVSRYTEPYGDEEVDFAYELTFGFHNGRFGIVREQHTGHDVDLEIGAGSSGARSYASTASEGAWVSLRTELSSFLVSLDPRNLALPCRPDAAFESSGTGLAALVDRILTDTDRAARDAYEEALRTFSPHVATVGTRPSVTLKELVFGLRDKTRVPAREVSSGLLATAGYLALLHLPVDRFLIEEPENGLHPQALLQIVDVLRRLADDGRQVVMTTHSPVLLNYIDAANIRIVTRTEADGVKVTPAVESKVFNELKQKVDFGALWYSLGDESLAVPR